MTHIQSHALVTNETLRNRVTMAIVALAAAARANPETPDVVRQFANHVWTAADASRHADKVLTGLALLDEPIRTAFGATGDQTDITDAMIDAGLLALVTTYGGAHL